MADEPTPDPAVSEDTQEEAASPEETPADAPAVDWESTDNPYKERYDNQQPTLTRTQQEAAELRQIVEGARAGDPEAIRLLGLDFVEDTEEDDDEYIDPDDRIDRLEQQLAQREEMTQAETEEAQEMDWLAENLDTLEKKEGAELSDKEMEIVVGNALDNRLENGQPDLEGAYKALREVQADYQKSYVESKRAPRVPSGTAGTEKLDLSTDEKRQEAMLQIMQEQGSE
jgi:hypothetical protein